MCGERRWHGRWCGGVCYFVVVVVDEERGGGEVSSSSSVVVVVVGGVEGVCASSSSWLGTDDSPTKLPMKLPTRYGVTPCYYTIPSVFLYFWFFMLSKVC